MRMNEDGRPYLKDLVAPHLTADEWAAVQKKVCGKHGIDPRGLVRTRDRMLAALYAGPVTAAQLEALI